MAIIYCQKTKEIVEWIDNINFNVYEFNIFLNNLNQNIKKEFYNYATC